MKKSYISPQTEPLAFLSENVIMASSGKFIRQGDPISDAYGD